MFYTKLRERIAISRFAVKLALLLWALHPKRKLTVTKDGKIYTFGVSQPYMKRFIGWLLRF